MPPLTPKALVFDVFGTCVDWRGSIIAEGRALDAAQRDHLTRVWHRLNPWPDTVPGLTRLKRTFVLGPLRVPLQSGRLQIV
jgi:hypothetical protein